MAKHIYDKDGHYTGKVLSESEHQRKQDETPEKYTCRYCLERIYKSELAKQEGFLFIGYCFSVCTKCFNLPQEKKKSKIEWVYLASIIFGLCFTIYFMNGGFT